MASRKFRACNFPLGAGMSIRPTSDHDRDRLKAATGRAIERAGGGAALAAMTRVETPALSKYKAGHEAGHYMPIDVAVDADMAAGAPIILSAMASIQGYSVTPLSGVTGKLTPKMIGSLIRETGDVSAAVLEAMADGTISPNERNAISREIDEALSALWTLRAALREA